MRDEFRSNRGPAGPPLLAVLMGCLVGTLIPPPAAGHAFGSFSISVFSQIAVAEQEVRVRWVVDMAELPAGVVVDLIDTDGDGVTTATEQTAYLALWIPSVLEQLELRVDGVELPLETVAHALSFPVGEGGEPALRLVADLVAPLPHPGDVDIHHATYRDANYTDYVGWREVAVSAVEGVSLVESSAPVEGRTKELTVYPADLGMNVPSSDAQFAFSLASTDTSNPGSSEDPAAGGPSFQIWPTGVLAVLAVLLVGLVAVVSERSAPARRRR